MKDFKKTKERMGHVDKQVTGKTPVYICARCSKLCPVTAVKCWHCDADLIKDALQLPNYKKLE